MMLAVPGAYLKDSATERVVEQRHPLGVVAAIVPWNYPLLLLALKLAPALIAGNCVIAKPAPTTPLTTLMLGALAADIFPAGVVQMLGDAGDVGPMLTAHPGIAHVSFTGSTATGRRVMAAAADTVKRFTLELGGNDPAILLDDADLTAQRRDGQVTDVMPVHQHSAGGDVVEARDEAHQHALARAGGAEEIGRASCRERV